MKDEVLAQLLFLFDRGVGVERIHPHSHLAIVINSRASSIPVYVFFSLYTGCPKKKYSGLILNNSETSEAIKLTNILLDRGKANLDFEILQLYIYKKLTEILMFKFGSIFLDVSKICEKRRIKY
jgi:hypothetical protein